MQVNGLCSCFQDERVLIQRSGLDFLLVGFPMHNTLLSAEHYQTLINSALITLLRRDMSLNRLVFESSIIVWLIDSNEATIFQTTVRLAARFWCYDWVNVSFANKRDHRRFQTCMRQYENSRDYWSVFQNLFQGFIDLSEYLDVKQSSLIYLISLKWFLDKNHIGKIQAW